MYMNSSTAETVGGLWSKLFFQELSNLLKNRFCKEKVVYFLLRTWEMVLFEKHLFCLQLVWPQMDMFPLGKIKSSTVVVWHDYMTISEVQFKAPPPSLSPQRVFVDEVCPLGGLCHISWCIVRAKVLCGIQCWSQGDGLVAVTLRWPGWAMRGTKMWKLKAWNQNVTLTTCTNQYLYCLCSIVLLWCCLFERLPVGNTHILLCLLSTFLV